MMLIGWEIGVKIHIFLLNFLKIWSITIRAWRPGRLELAGGQRSAVGGVEACHKPRGDVTQHPRFLVLCQPRAEFLLWILTQLRQPVTDLLVLDGVEAPGSVQEAGHTVQGLIGAEAGVSSLKEGDDQIVTSVAPQFSFTEKCMIEVRNLTSDIAAKRLIVTV